MTKVNIITFITIFLITSGCGNSDNLKLTTEPSHTKVLGSIVTETTWDFARSPYIVTGDVIVERGVTLTIEPRVEVRFDGFYNLIIKGVLIANGISVDQAITFTSNSFQPEMKNWKGIRIDNANDNKTILRYVKIEYAQTALDVFSSSPQVTDCIIQKNYTGLNGLNMHSTVSYNLVTDNVYGMIFELTEFGEVTNNTITRNEVGIKTRNALKVRHNNLFGNLGYNLVFKYFSQNRPQQVDARYNWWGTTDIKHIEEQIYDKQDESKLGEVLYLPYEMSMITDAGPR